MIISIGYKEVADFVKRRFPVNVSFAKESDKVLNARIEKFIIGVNVKLYVEEVGNDVVSLRYECPEALSYIVKGGILLCKNIIPDAVQVDTDKSSVKVYPNKINGLDKALEFIKLSDIVFEDDAIKIIVTAA